MEIWAKDTQRRAKFVRLVEKLRGGVWCATAIQPTSNESSLNIPVFRFLAQSQAWFMSRPGHHSPDFTTRTYVLVQEAWTSNPA